MKPDELKNANAKPSPAPPALSDYSVLWKTPSYLASTLAMASMTFALGGLAVWMPTFLNRFWAMNAAQAGTLFGAVTVVAGLLGSLAGGWLADKLLTYTGKAYFLVSGIGLIAAMPMGIIAILSERFTLTLIAFFAAETLAFLNMGPLNAVIVWVTRAPLRSMAFAANIFVIHALGDALSPTLIGRCSDLWGLKGALVGTMGMLGISGCICLWGARHLEMDSRAIDHA